MKTTTKKELLARYVAHDEAITKLATCPRRDEPRLVDAVRVSAEKLREAVCQALPDFLRSPAAERVENLLLESTALLASRADEAAQHRDANGRPCPVDETPLSAQLEAERLAEREVPDPFAWGVPTEQLFGSARKRP